MYILTDETGSLESTREGSLGLCTLVMIDERSLTKLFKELDKLGIDPSKIKSSDIGLTDREEIVKILVGLKGFTYICWAHDPKYDDATVIKEQQAEQADRIDKIIQDAKKDGFKEREREMTVFRNQYKSLKHSDFVKFTIITEMYLEWLRFFQFDLDYKRPWVDDWQFRHRVDTQSQPGKFLRLLTGFMKLVLHPDANNELVVHYNKDIPFHHPFHTVNAGRDGAAEGNKLLSDFKVDKEENCPGLFIPDFIGNTILRAYTSKSDSKEYRDMARKLSTKRAFSMKKIDSNKRHVMRVMSFDRSKKALDPKLKAFLEDTAIG